MTAALLGLSLLAGADPAAQTPPVRPPDPFGYSSAFDEELRRLGTITPADLARRFPGPKYIDKLTLDPTKAKFFDRLMLDPEKLPERVRGAAHLDLRLDDAELALLKKNGFVVSGRLSGESFGGQFHRIYARDLPVFITADSMLHAWHFSFDHIVAESEQAYLAPLLDEILTGMADAIPAARKEYGEGVLGDPVRDADYFLAVARSLLAGSEVAGRLDQSDRIRATLLACVPPKKNAGPKWDDSSQADGSTQRIDLFGRPRDVDFSQMTPRGHYERTMLLRRYFRAMMWLGRTDLRVAGNPELASPRELGAAVVLNDLLTKSGKAKAWRQFDRLLQALIGHTDSMTFDQLDGVLKLAGLKSPADLKDEAALRDLQATVLKTDAGKQEVRGDVYDSPLGPEKVSLPRSFTVLGQKFAVDSWALSKLVYDDIVRDGVKVQRRVPSSLDVAFAVFGNDAAAPYLTDRLSAMNGQKFRDGLPYQENLLAARAVIESEKPAVRQETVYALWLDTLRQLSRPTTGGEYPEAMRTRAWAERRLNTQLASWTELRHDTLLYVKQSYTSRTLCEYPAGLVEPNPAFWERFEQMARRSASLLEAVPVSEKAKAMQSQQVAFLRTFADRVAQLTSIAAKQTASKPLDDSEVRLLRRIVEEQGGSGMPRFTGWYPKLFYGDAHGSESFDALVADVHTDVADDQVGDPGCVLHEGVGRVDMLVIAAENGPDHLLFVGPVLSHYEFDTPIDKRLTDTEWQDRLRSGNEPARPEWTRSYLVPGPKRKE